MDTCVRVGPPAGDRWLLLRNAVADSRGFVTFQVEVHGPTLNATTGVLTLPTLGHFFRELADDWRGWDGERVWHATEYEMSIVATHATGTVTLRVTIRESYGPDRWQVTISLPIEGGEEMKRLASQIVEFELNSA